MKNQELLKDFIIEEVMEVDTDFIKKNAHAIPHLFKVSLFECMDLRRDNIPDIIFSVVEQISSFDSGLVYIWDPWNLWFCRGVQGEITSCLENGNIITHTVKKSGQHVLIKDSSSFGFNGDELPFSFTSMMALPVYLDSNTIGCLELYRKGSNAFNETELALVKQMVLLSERTLRDALSNGKKVGDFIDMKMDVKPRQVLMEILHQYEEQARRLSYPLSIALVTVNDGNEKEGFNSRILEGISTLRKVARKFKENLRCYDNILRYEDMSFFVILPGCTSSQAKRAIENASVGIDQRMMSSVQVGIASFPDEAQDMKGVISAAHQATAYAKKTSVNIATCTDAGIIHSGNVSAELSMKKVLCLSPGHQTLNLFIDILKVQCQAQEIQLRSTPPGDLLVWGDADLGFLKQEGLPDELYKWIITYLSPAWAYILGLSADLQDWNLSMLSLCSVLSDIRAGYPLGYSMKVADNMYSLAIALDMREEDANRWANSALVANLGYIGMPSSVLTKDELSHHDKKKISWHPIISAGMIKDASVLNCDDQILIHHHENIDGSGYPRGLKGSDIPLAARALRVVDTYNAIMSPRLYRPQKKQDEAIRELYTLSSDKLDPSITNVFMDVIGS